MKKIKILSNANNKFRQKLSDIKAKKCYTHLKYTRIVIETINFKIVLFYTRRVRKRQKVESGKHC